MDIFLATSGSIKGNSYRSSDVFTMNLHSIFMQPVEVKYFGASTLQIKISRYWKEITPEEYLALREKLISTLISYACGPKLVLTRLCLAVRSFG